MTDDNISENNDENVNDIENIETIPNQLESSRRLDSEIEAMEDANNVILSKESGGSRKKLLIGGGVTLLLSVIIAVVVTFMFNGDESDEKITFD